MKMAVELSQKGLLGCFILSPTNRLISFCILCIMGLGSNLLAQTAKVEYFSPWANITYNKSVTNQTTHGRGIEGKVGYESLGGIYYRFYRKGLNFSIGVIPQNATITGCELAFNSGFECGSFDGTFMFTQIPYTFPILNDENAYNTIKIGSKLDSIDISSETTYNIDLDEMVQPIQNTIQSSGTAIGLGIYNKFETSTYGSSISNIVFKINFTIPTPPTPGNLRTSNITSSGCKLEWDAVSGNVTGYKIYRNGSLFTTTTTTEAQITGLCPGNSTILRVKAYNNYGDGDLSPEKSLLTNPTTLTGSVDICSSGNAYTINNLPSDGSIYWESSSNVSLGSTQGSNPCYFLENSSGTGWIKATISSQLCGTSYLTKYISAGAPIIYSINFQNPIGGEGYWCSSHYGNYFEVGTVYENVTYEARLLSWPSLAIYTTNSNALPGQDPFGYTPAGWYVFEIRATNNCGTSDWFGNEVEYLDCNQELRSFQIQTYPNPTSGDLKVSIVNVKPNVLILIKNERVKCELYYLYNSQPVKLWEFDNYQDIQSVNLGGLKTGQYIMRITIGKFTQSTKVIIK